MLRAGGSGVVGLDEAYGQPRSDSYHLTMARLSSGEPEPGKSEKGGREEGGEEGGREGKEDLKMEH